jgi:hypothetical protein
MAFLAFHLPKPSEFKYVQEVLEIRKAKELKTNEDRVRTTTGGILTRSHKDYYF